MQGAAAVVALLAAILSAQSLASAREGLTTYQIQPGDSLSTIAQVTGLPVDRLMGLNGIRNPDFIVAGQVLSLDAAAPSATSVVRTASSPTASPSTAAASTSNSPSLAAAGYTVRDGDTLWDIAQLTGASVDTLVSLNSLGDADALRVGQTLKLPASASGPRVAGASATATPRARASTTPTVSPTTRPATTVTLQQKVVGDAQRVAGPNARVGIAATNLVTGERVLVRADDSFPSASVMKLPILVELERQVASGTLAWTDQLRAQTGAMISVSDNTAANQVTNMVKMQSVNDTLGRLGLGSTRFLNLFTDDRSKLNPGQNSTTPANMAKLLELIATDQLVSPQASADMRSLLLRNTDRSKLVRLLPTDARVAHKSGWFDSVAADAGIVTVDRGPARWVIAVFTANLPDAETGNQTIATISRDVYDAWAP
jgi:beta-lactamase class A